MREASITGTSTVPAIEEDVLLLDIKRNLNEFATQDLKIDLEQYKVFEIKCNEIPITALPAGAKAPRYDTEFEKINPLSHNIASLMSGFKRKIAGVMVPADPDEFARIESQMALDRSNMKLKQEFEECLKRAICIELIQIKDFYMTTSEGQSSKGHLEVRSTRGSSALTGEQRLSSGLIFIGKMQLQNMV